MSSTEPDEAPDFRPRVTDRQRRVLDELPRIYLKTGGWPTPAYLEQELEEQGIELDNELRTMPEWVFSPDNRRHGGVLYVQQGDRVRLMIRGLVACSDAEREIKMLVSTIRWAVHERREVRQQPHEVTAKTWRAADAIGAMGDAIGSMNPPAYSCKLVLELLQMEPADLPKWGGQPHAFPDWQLDIPTGIKKFRNVETIDDYLAETDTQVPKDPPTRVTLPNWPKQGLPLSALADDHPIFGRATKRSNSFDCFVLLPLREPFLTIYSEGIAPVAEQLGITCGHAQGILGPGRIINDIYSSITFAQVVIAELTGGNRNVFYELGIAHEQRKQVVLMSQTMDDVPFDVRELRVVVYDWDAVSAKADELIEKLRPNLEEALRAARNGA
jgi:hypothetical protein